VGVCPTLEGVEWWEEDVKPIHHGKLGVNHGERRSFRNVPRKCSGRTAILDRAGLSPQIDVLIR
jgi:hypothetical protein